jgi:hypothetical protein
MNVERGMQAKIDKIETEIRRLNCHDTRTNCSGICVYLDDDLPRGWVRVSDGTGEAYGLADEIAAAIAGVPATGEIRDDAAIDWEACWDALGGFAEHSPRDSQEWPEDLITIEPLEDGTADDNPDTIVIVETNAGTRYAAGPHGTSCCALGDWLESSEPLALTREAAIVSGCHDQDSE